MRDVLLAMLFGMLSCAHAADWAVVPMPPNLKVGGPLEVDRSSIIRSGPAVTVWTRAVYQNPQPVRTRWDTNGYYRIAMSMREFDCTRRLSASRRAVFLLAAEDAIPVVDEAFSGALEPVRPDTRDETILNFVCGFK